MTTDKQLMELQAQLDAAIIERNKVILELYNLKAARPRRVSMSELLDDWAQRMREVKLYRKHLDRLGTCGEEVRVLDAQVRVLRACISDVLELGLHEEKI